MLEKNDGRAFGRGLWASSCLTNRRQAAWATPGISNVGPCANDGGGPNGIRTRVYGPPRASCFVSHSWKMLTQRLAPGDSNSEGGSRSRPLSIHGHLR